MTGVATSDEALRALRAAIDRWRVDSQGVAGQAGSVVEGFRNEIAHELRQRTSRLAALEDALATLPPDGDRTQLVLEIANARAEVDRATRAKNMADDAERDVRALQRHIAGAAGARAASAAYDLSRRLESLSGYRAGGSGAAAAPDAGAASSSGPVEASSETPFVRALREHGVTSVSLDEASHEDNPVIDGYHKGGTTVADYRWAVETWETTVQPGLAAGATREDFERRDQARGATGFRRTAAVFDMFLGDDRLVFSRRSDGSLDVVNGRHRIDVARSLGIKRLPGEIR